MNSTLPSKNDCPICKSESSFFTRKYNWQILRCNTCELIFLDPIPKHDDLIDLYDQDYFIGARKGFGYRNYEIDKKCMLKTFFSYLKIINSFQPEKGRLLDVGASTGTFVKISLENGWQAEGVEISEFASEIGRANGLKISTGTIDIFYDQKDIYSAISGLDVFEHIANPFQFLETVHRLLRSGGIFCINLPDSGSMWAKFWGRKWNAILPPEHIFLYNKKNITILLEKCGFKLIHFSRIPKTFTVPYIFQVLYRWTNQKTFLTLANFSDRYCQRIYLPLDVKDNMYLIAKKAD